MNMNKLVHSLTVPCFVFNFNSRKSKQALFVIFNTKWTSKIKKLQASFIQKKSKLNQVSVTALSDCQLLHQVSENAILHPIIPYLQARSY